MSDRADIADVCLLLEGTYPYVSGGVSSWVHDIIGGLPDLRFRIVSLLPNNAPRKRVYQVPANVVGIDHLNLHRLPQGWPWLPRLRPFFRAAELYLQNIMQRGSLDDVRGLVDLFAPLRRRLGADILYNSHASWEMLLSLYKRSSRAARSSSISTRGAL